MACTRKKFLTKAAAHIGYRETPVNLTKFGKWYGMNGSPWCDMFVSYVAYECGATDIIGKFAYTPSHADFFKKKGLWGKTPKAGAIVFFDFPGDGVNRISHVGIVEKVLPGGKIQTIEGNTSPSNARNGGGVYRMVRSTSSVVGYGYPKFTPEPKPKPKPKPAPKPVKAPVKSVTTRPKKTVTASLLNIRAKAGLTGKVVAKVPKGTKLTILGETKNWYHVKTPTGIKGYASKKYVK